MHNVHPLPLAARARLTELEQYARVYQEVYGVRLKVAKLAADDETYQAALQAAA